MEEPRHRPHRPVPHADLTELIDAAGGLTAPSTRAELAAATAAVLVRAGRDAHGVTGGDDAGAVRDADRDAADAERFVALADRIGLDTLAALWQDSDPVSLPGALWALYLLRQWFHGDGEQVRRLWRAGEPYAPADAVVAGVAEPGDVASVQQVTDAVLAGVYRGDLAVALERAAAVFRVVAAGRRELAPDDGAGASERGLAARNDRVAADLTAAAARWRAGTLH